MDGLRVDETLAETDTQLLRMKINSHLKVLTSFKELREAGKSRSEYILELKEYFCGLYSYNSELMEIFFNLFSPHECSAFLESMEEERPVTIRTNTLKARRKELAVALAARRVELEPVGDWSKVGLKITESKVPIGATPEYLGGQYMLQSACSFLPVLALAPKPGEKVLDMAAAPGGKTTYIAQMMKNQGVLVANDLRKDRLKVVFGEPVSLLQRAATRRDQLHRGELRRAEDPAGDEGLRQSAPGRAVHRARSHLERPLDQGQQNAARREESSPPPARAPQGRGGLLQGRRSRGLLDLFHRRRGERRSH